MAKLIVEVDLTFNTDALLVDEDFSEVHLDYDAGRSKFESTDYQELEFELISTHPEAEAAFLFYPKDGDKASVSRSSITQMHLASSSNSKVLSL